jgi:hypothetical protein
MGGPSGSLTSALRMEQGTPAFAVRVFFEFPIQLVDNPSVNGKITAKIQVAGVCSLCDLFDSRRQAKGSVIAERVRVPSRLRCRLVCCVVCGFGEVWCAIVLVHGMAMFIR